MSTPLNGSVLKCFEILKLFSPARPELNAQILSEILGMTQATAHRFLVTLEEAGALISYKRGCYSLSRQVEELGDLAFRLNPLASQLQPIIQQTSTELNQSVMACRMTRQGPTCIAVATAGQLISINIKVGTVLPFLTTAQGKLWLAHLPKSKRSETLANIPYLQATPNENSAPDDFTQELDKIKTQGFALNSGENEPDIGAISVPVFNSKGHMTLSISVFGILNHFDEIFNHMSLQRLNQSAKIISHNILPD